MSRPKTHAEKDAEIEELKAKLDNAPVATEDVAVLKKNLKHSEETEARLMAEIEEMKDAVIVDGKVEGTDIHVFTPDEYDAYSKEKGLIMGRKPDTKTNCTIEELRALINSNWTPSMIMRKHGLSAEDLKQLVWKLSKRELRDKPIRYSIERDNFSREG